MTVPYSNKVATSSFSCFLRLLFRWKGSIYKLLWKEFAVFALLFYFLSFTYRFLLNPFWKTHFEALAIYCRDFVELIPLAFVLGFYVSIVCNRFWEQFGTIPYPHRMALFVSALITGIDERGRLMRRTIMRYLCLSHLMTMAAISPPVKKRFPDYQHMTEAGFMLVNEQRIIENMSTASSKYFVPLVWSASLVLRARKEGRIKDDFAVKTLIDEINDYRGKCGTLFAYDFVTIPIVYTQVVTIAVYTFFLCCLMGRQFIENSDKGDLYFPLFTFLQFFFYMGWLKVAESLVNPFGEDDDDFEINSMIDKNLPTAYLIVDEMHNEHPELIRDQYWDSFNRDIVVPYNQASQKFQTQEFLGSAANIDIPAAKTTFLPSVASNMNRMGSQVSMGQASRGAGEEGAGAGTPKIARKISKRLGRSTSRISAFVKNTISRQNSRLEVTKEDEEEEDIPLNTLNNPKMADEDKLIGSKKFPSDLMFSMSIDEESSPNTPQSSPPTTLHASIPPMFPPQVDPFISNPTPLPQKNLSKRTLSVSSTSSSSKNLGRIDVNCDAKDADSLPSPQPLQTAEGAPQPLSPSTTAQPSLTPLSQLLVTSTTQPPFTQTTTTTTTTTTQAESSASTTLPPASSSSASTTSSSHAHIPSSKPMPSTSLRTLEPVIESAESPEAFVGAVMNKLKEIRENK